MEIKKTAQANLEKDRHIFWLLGFIFAGSTLFVALEWQFEDNLSLDGLDLSSIYIESELSPIAEALQPEPETGAEQEPEKVEEPAATVYEDFIIVKEMPEEQPPVTGYRLPVSGGHKESVVESKPIEEAYTGAEVMPSFPGGVVELNRFLFTNIQYPASAISQNKSGRVWCSFIVEKDGTITNVKVEKNVFISLDQEAVRVLQTMPAWVPGSEHGERVRVKCYLPIVFQL
ncbi:MAG: TonB family protein [Candidatus Symbiothrix sp.]|nr:TonB family protein [Candidatus Symbiothrix sp.]